MIFRVSDNQYGYSVHSSTKSITRTLQILINGTTVPLEKQPRILGVTRDTMYIFAAHCRNQVVKVRARNNILKALTDTTWGRRPLFSHTKLLADL